MHNKILLSIGVALVVLGLLRPNINSLLPNNTPSSVDVLEISAPKDETLLKEANDIVNIIKNNMPKSDCKKLRDLYLDIKQLIKLDGDDQVIKNTEEIRQANSIAGAMLRLDMKGKYPELAKECKEVVVAAIGDDQIILSPELRLKSMDSFDALAWAFNEGSK